MRLSSWLAAGLAAAGGYLLCRKLRGVDDRLLSGRGRQGRSVPEGETQSVSTPVMSPQSTADAEVGSGGVTSGAPIERRVVKEVMARPGLLQTELYSLLPDLSRKRLQELLLRLDRQGKLKRATEKGTYRLFPTV